MLKKQSSINDCIGIIRESKYTWERRVAITPKNCKKLVSEGIKIVVQPCKIRCFTDDEYLEAGAEISEDLSKCKIIVGIQEVPVEELMENKTYLFFSHTIKAQKGAKDLIVTIKKQNIRLIDYEAIREVPDNKNLAGRRLVSFGRIAGVAGTLNIFSGIGQLLLSRKISNQFLFTKLGYMHCSLQEAFDSLKKLGEYISEQFLPNEICPFVIGVLGSGEVGTGVIESLKCLPHKIITKKELLEDTFEKRRDIIYVVIFNSEDLYENINTGKFDWKQYTHDPENYVSKFSEVYLEKLSLVINCLYWEKKFPRVISKDQLKNLFFKKKMKLLGISDISCDINGSIEVLESYNSNSKPFVVYEPLQMLNVNLVDDATKDGIMFTAIPYLAASFSYDASEYFSDLLFPFLKELVKSNYPLPEDKNFKLSEELNNAIIISHGKIVNYVNPLRIMLERQNTPTKQDSKNIIQLNLNSNNLKITGHLIDRKVFQRICVLLLKYDLEFEVLNSNIGWNESDLSVVYLSVAKENNDAYQECLKEITEITNREECELKTIS